MASFQRKLTNTPQWTQIKSNMETMLRALLIFHTIILKSNYRWTHLFVWTYSTLQCEARLSQKLRVSRKMTLYCMSKIRNYPTNICERLVSSQLLWQVHIYNPQALNKGQMEIQHYTTFFVNKMQLSLCWKCPSCHDKLSTPMIYVCFFFLCLICYLLCFI